jgi:2,4-dienoyl-CoA reductase-like NADH-dependent reductase (Old Yellow Enzyme family)
MSGILHTPFRTGDIELKNRVVMAPMTRSLAVMLQARTTPSKRDDRIVLFPHFPSGR